MSKRNLVAFLMVIAGFAAVLLGVLLLALESGVIGVVSMLVGVAMVVTGGIVSDAPRDGKPKYLPEYEEMIIKSKDSTR